MISISELFPYDQSLVSKIYNIRILVFECKFADSKTNIIGSRLFIGNVSRVEN